MTKLFPLAALFFTGATFTVSFNQEPLFETEDATFPKPGKIGLWTKADSITYFADFSYSKERPVRRGVYMKQFALAAAVVTLARSA